MIGKLRFARATCLVGLTGLAKGCADGQSPVAGGSGCPRTTCHAALFSESGDEKTKHNPHPPEIVALPLATGNGTSEKKRPRG